MALQKVTSTPTAHASVVRKLWNSRRIFHPHLLCYISSLELQGNRMQLGAKMSDDTSFGSKCVLICAAASTGDIMRTFALFWSLERTCLNSGSSRSHGQRIRSTTSLFGIPTQAFSTYSERVADSVLPGKLDAGWGRDGGRHIIVLGNPFYLRGNFHLNA